MLTGILHPLRLLFKIVRYPKGFSRKILIGFVPGIISLIVAQAITVLGPKLLEAIVQQAIGNAPSGVVVALIFGYGTAVASGKAIGELTDYLLIKQANVMQQILRQRLVEAVVTFPSDTIAPSRLMAVWQRSSQAFEGILNAAIFQIVPKLATLAAIAAIVVASYGVGAVIPACLGGAAYAVWLRHAFRGVTKAVDRQNETESNLTSDLHGFFAAHRQIRIGGVDRRLLSRTYDLSRMDLDANLHLTAWQSLWMGGNAIIIGVTLATSLSFSFVIGAVNAAGLIALSFYIVMIFEPIESLSEAIRTILIEGRRAETAANIILAGSEERPLPNSIDWTRLHFRDVTVQDNDGRSLFEPISFVLGRGEKVLICAASGVGKSSLAHSVFFGGNHLAGAVLAETADGAMVQINALREIGSMLTQENAILNRSIEDNIRWSREDGGLLPVAIQCLGDRLEGRIKEQPSVDSEMIGMLSGGQKRRVSVARLVQHNHNLAILDEPVTGLDAEGARRIIDLLMSIEPMSMIFLLHSAPPNVVFSQSIELKGLSAAERDSMEDTDDDPRLAQLLED